jgi:hypothetical protein
VLGTPGTIHLQRKGQINFHLPVLDHNHQEFSPWTEADQLE